MNITRETKAAQNDILRIELTKEDYSAGYEKKLKKYSKEMNVNGFRKGAVPVGMIKKMYGESILAEEINHLADDALQNFVKENDIKLLGRPILADGQELLDIKPNEDKTYQLNFEIGFEPDYSLDFSGKFAQYEIDITPAMIEKEIENVKGYFTKLEDSAEPIADGDSIYFNYDNGKDIVGDSFCSTNELTEAGIKLFIGKKVADKFDAKAMDIINNEKIDVKKYILNIKEETEEITTQVNENISIEITNVKKKNAPESLNAEQIGQITRDETKTTMDDLKAALENDIKAQYQNLAQNFLRNDVYEHIASNTKMDLPVDFLKRWIVSEKENNLTEESVNKDFYKIEKSIKWDLITAKFSRENDIKVDIEEIKNEFKTRYMSYFMQSGYTPPAEQMDKFIADAMKDSNSVRKTYESLLDTKILDKMIESVKTTVVKYSEDQFINESKTRNEKRQAEETYVHDENCGHNH